MLRRLPLPLAAAGLIAVTLLPGAPAQAADDAGLGDWAAECADVDAVFCIEEATITPVGGSAEPVAALGLTASAAGLGESVRWSIDGWDPLDADPAMGEVRLVLRTGSFVPRVTTAVADGLTVRRTDDGAGGFILTVTGRAARVEWTTGENAETCAALLYCGDHDQMADAAGTGWRFEGSSHNVEDRDQDYLEAIDGAYLGTNAQGRSDTLTYEIDGWQNFSLGMIGGPQLTRWGTPVHNSVSAWLPPGYFAAAGTTADEAAATGFDLIGFFEYGETFLTAETTPVDGGVRLDAPDVSFGASMGELHVLPNPSNAVLGQSTPSVPLEVTAATGAEFTRVRWSAPESDGGIGLYGFRARAFTEETGGTVAGSCDAGSEEDTCVIYGLDDDETYHFAVTAFNALGEGDPSERVTAGTVTVPGKPHEVRLAPGARSLLASWSAPESDGGADVESYTARAYRTAKEGVPVAECDTWSRMSCPLTGLTGGARYYVEVTATNAAGEGPASSRRSATVWNVAGAPRSGGAKSAKGKVTMSWDAPAANGGTAVTGYRAELFTASRGGSVAARCTTTATGRSCTVPGLKAGRTYYAAVTAVNGAGSSAPTSRVKVVVKR